MTCTGAGAELRAVLALFEPYRAERINTAIANRLDTTSHIDARRNRVAIKGSFMAMQRLGASKEASIGVMRSLKDEIRHHDAVEAGDELEITIRVGSDKQGAVVSMSSTLASQREGHGRLIRLE